MKHKSLAYITRQHQGQLQLLVVEHRDYPGAGVQVPAGTVDDGETPETTLFREVQEEAGLRPAQLRLVRKLAEHENQEWQTVRHVFHLAAADALPDAWTHIVQSGAEDDGMVFEFYWLDLPTGVELAGNQGMWLGELGTGSYAHHRH
jgi:8-oxo-dGTP pyrophosphatase MutT (NUDIX family)